MLRVTYNAPVTLTFALISAAVLLLDSTLLRHSLIPAVFTAPGGPQSEVPFRVQAPLDYLRLLFHIFGHSDWNHLISNMAFILLLGPTLEDRYGSAALALMTGVTALVTGVLNACFAPTPMVGSSDIAFMMILLASFTSLSKNEIPLSFLLILALYIGRELAGFTPAGGIATAAHIAGGLCGSLFAFLASPRRRDSASRTKGPAAKKPSDDDTTVIGSITL